MVNGGGETPVEINSN
jgi:hypothetical protein